MIASLAGSARGFGPLVILAGALAQANAAVIYVDVNSPVRGDGTSWQSPFIHLQNALHTAAPGDEIRVAGGTYRPDRGTGQTLGDRNATFAIGSGVAVVGGYAGSALPSAPDTRSITQYRTTLSGDLAGDDAAPFLHYGDNARHVVTLQSASSTRIDGCTVSGGHADGGNGSNPLDTSGAGVLSVDSAVQVVDCTLEANLDDPPTPPGDNIGGAGMHTLRGSAQFARCTIQNNKSNQLGGGLFNLRGDIVLQDCVLLNNTAVIGGGIQTQFQYDPPTNTVISRCTITGNSADNGGGGLATFVARLHMDNCLVTENVASFGAGIDNELGDDPVFQNCTIAYNRTTGGSAGGVFVAFTGGLLNSCIVWKNHGPHGEGFEDQFGFDDGGFEVGWSCVSGWPYGGTSTADDPQFVDQTTGNYRLAHTSPCVDQGDPGYSAPPGVTDLDGGTRVLARGAGLPAVVDMGAYEWHCYPNCDGSTADPILTVNDFQCFLNAFAAGSPYANCDGSSVPPVLNINDFMCFLNAFASGCP